MYNFWCFVAFYAVLLQNLSFMRFTLFCREICFVAIYALWHGEKMGQRFCLWRKKDKYQVWSWVIQNLNLKKWKCRGRKIYFKQSHLGNKKKPPNFRWCQNSCRVKSYHESVLAALFPQFNTQCITHNALLFAHLRLISKVHGWFIMLQNYLETSV